MTSFPRTAFLLLATVCTPIAGAQPSTAPVALPSRSGVVRLIVTGDAGSTSWRLRDGILAVQKKTPIDGIVLTGDNFYPCGISSIEDRQWSKVTSHFGPANVPIFPVLGNHDYGDPHPAVGKPQKVCGDPHPEAEVEASGRIAHWVFPSRHYVLANALATFVMIDSQPIASDWTAGYLGSASAEQESAWLKAQLDRTRTPWRIVLGHHTIYSSGEHGRSNGGNQQNMRKLLPMLERASVDLYICGHDHDMELIGGTRGGRPLFLISGAGSELYEVKPRSKSGEPPSIWYPGKSFYGFALLEITSRALTITFYDANGLKRGGPIIVKK